MDVFITKMLYPMEILIKELIKKRKSILYTCNTLCINDESNVAIAAAGVFEPRFLP